VAVSDATSKQAFSRLNEQLKNFSDRNAVAHERLELALLGDSHTPGVVGEIRELKAQERLRGKGMDNRWALGTALASSLLALIGTLTIAAVTLLVNWP